ncbi:hypothetical protein CDAR_86011 [Caerostris darwini]|uniref:Uncharacterized protein n=1 Tax=Caerostris darwini TaxID=1538125 RepID=A0AAV4V521_9ARAC|nr:hypothetical protein CDAR_86011 [Caerostris darwini]
MSAWKPATSAEANETFATTWRRTPSWKSFRYLLGAVIERNKRRWARPDMIQELRARLRLGRRRSPATQGASSAGVAAVDCNFCLKIGDILLLCVSPRASKWPMNYLTAQWQRSLFI